ncbi:MAG TPA: phosphate ABC transporter ATP-binding protein PstB [Acidobacteriota bacterium]|nr:phosphate ABC transporter ATP-binding protein PstB [Acidobacteriota bacterium]
MAETADTPVLRTEKLTVTYAGKRALEEIDLQVHRRRITALIGPSGCGKSTLLRTLNRMNDFIPGAAIGGKVYFEDIDLYGQGVDVTEVRRRIGMVFQSPNPFPKSIYKNVVWGPRIHRMGGDSEQRVEQALKRAALWSEVHDRLHQSALELSGGQQQRLCIARALAMDPEVILMDEPCSALDPVATNRIEELLSDLRNEHTIVIVTHNMQQARRIADYTAFLDAGRLIEFASTDEIFDDPKEKRTADYVAGRFG